MQKMPEVGEPAPWFKATALEGNPRYTFDTAAGRHIVMLFAGSAGAPQIAAALAVVAAHGDMLDDHRACFFGVTIDPEDAAAGRIAQRLPGIRWFLDYDRAVSRAYGATDANDSLQVSYHPFWLILDPMLRVVARAPVQHGAAVFTELRRLVAAEQSVTTAPVLVVPNVLTPDLCASLVALYETRGGEDSGFMREEGGMTVLKTDHHHKRRSDHTIDDEALIETLKTRLAQNLRPMIRRAFQFDANRVERFIIACYDADEGGHFRPHRDNTTKGTAHRRFACTINLNAGDYEGGDLRFPEFGTRSYRAPTGGAVIFSCSLLHEAMPVTRGRRYAFLPFLYDDAAAQLRERNLQFLEPELRDYNSGQSAKG